MSTLNRSLVINEATPEIGFVPNGGGGTFGVGRDDVEGVGAPSVFGGTLLVVR